MTDKEALNLALEALENSVDLVRHEYEDAVHLYSNYPSRAGKISGLLALLRAHEDSITAIKEALAQPAQEALYGMNQDDWKDLTDAVKKVRDGRGIYLACRPADVFQEWFLALGTAKLKEKNT
jgi:hypothetical protein